jgi:hypothetical protein
MTSDDRLRRLLYGIRRQFQDIPDRSARAKTTIKRVRPRERGRIGQVEDMIHQYLAFADQRELTTGELARLIYAHPLWDRDRLRDKGEPLPKIKSWQYARIRRAAPTFADRVGGGRSRGGFRWRLRDEYFYDVRKRKTARDAARREAKKG